MGHISPQDKMEDKIQKVGLSDKKNNKGGHFILMAV